MTILGEVLVVYGSLKRYLKTEERSGGEEGEGRKRAIQSEGKQ